MGQFYSDNQLRRYPLDDAAPPGRLTRRSDGLRFDLPTPTIVECLTLAGDAAGFDPAGMDVTLDSIAREGSTLSFALRCGGYPTPAVHPRDAGDREYVLTRVDVTAGDAPCDPVFAWRSTLVTGDLGPLLALLPDGDALDAGPAFAMLPTLCESWRGAYVSALNVANEGRLTVLPPGAAATAPPAPADHVLARCLVGAVTLAAGYNAAVDQDTAAATLTAQAAQGAGLGEPCAEVPAYPGEAPPAGSPFLSGGPGCDALILAVDGRVGPALALYGGAGVSVYPDPDDPHGVVVDLSGGAS